MNKTEGAHNGNDICDEWRILAIMINLQEKNKVHCVIISGEQKHT